MRAMDVPVLAKRESGLVYDFSVWAEEVEQMKRGEFTSGSNGDIADGTFVANDTDLHSLAELAQRVRSKHSKIMNEVNINIKDGSAVLGLFVNKAMSEAPKVHILMAQEYFKMQTGKTLPIYVYDSKGGELTEYNPPKEERESIVTRLKESRRLHSSSLGYWLETEEKGHYESLHFGSENRKA